MFVLLYIECAYICVDLSSLISCFITLPYKRFSLNLDGFVTFIYALNCASNISKHIFFLHGFECWMNKKGATQMWNIVKVNFTLYMAWSTIIEFMHNVRISDIHSSQFQTNDHLHASGHLVDFVWIR